MAEAEERLLKESKSLRKKVAELTRIIDANHLADATREHKDRLFRFIFGNPDNREWTLMLYNALNGSHHEDAGAIEFNAIGDVLYVRMRNDVSFIIGCQMVMWEQQSTLNPNMPL